MPLRPLRLAAGRGPGNADYPGPGLSADELTTSAARNATRLRRVPGTGFFSRLLANLLERDRMFTDRLREEATGLGLPVIDVDTTMTEDDLTRRVTRAFGLG